VLLSGGAVVYGLISPAPDFSWRAQGSIIVDKDTGTRYVLLGGALRPAANYASARLAGSSKPVSMVSHKTLAGTPVGPYARTSSLFPRRQSYIQRRPCGPRRSSKSRSSAVPTVRSKAGCRALRKRSSASASTWFG